MKDKKDRAFFSFITKYDFLRHRSHLRDLVRSKYPDVHPDLVGFTVDFTGGSPPNYSAFLVQEIPDDDNADYTKNEVIRLAKEDGSETGTHAIMLRVIFCDVLGPVARRFDFIETFEDRDSTERPRTRPGVKRTSVRPSGHFKDDGVQVPLEACPDLIDNYLSLMAEEAAKNPSLIRVPKGLAARVIQEVNLSFMLKDTLDKADNERNTLTLKLPD